MSTSRYRNTQVYVSGQTKHRLRLISRVFASRDEACGVEALPITVDELAETLLSKIITADYPEILVLEEEIAKLEEKCSESMKNRKPKVEEAVA